MLPEFNRRSILKASAGLVAVGLASRWAGRLGLARAVADTGHVVLTEDLRLGAAELAGGALKGTKLEGGRLTLGGWGAGQYVSPEVRSSFPATHVGVHWRGASPQAASFWLRSSADGVNWSQWQPVIVEAGHDREASAESFGALIRADRAERFQFRTRLEDGKGDTSIESVTMTVLNAEDGPSASPLAGRLSLAPSTKPLTYSREAWGANEGLRFDNWGEIWPRDYVPNKKIVVHHTATPDYASPSEAQAYVRAIYTYHASTRGWGDIGYCWLIDKFGNSYEGRRGRGGPGYDGPGGRELVSEDVVAGHAMSYNHGSSGIAMLGTFEGVPPSSAALSKLRDVLAWECSRHGMNPEALTDFLTASDSWHRGLPNICGHRDTAATDCPGSSLYALLPGLRGDIASRLANSSAPTVSMTSAPAEATRANRNVSYSWQGSGGSGAKQYSYYLEGWSLDSNVLVVYESGFNGAREPAWRPWTTATRASFTLYQPGHYTFHVRARDSKGRVSVYQANRTLLGTAEGIPRRGYWLVASDGGIFTFGGAGFHGSTGNIALNQPVVGMAATPTGNGYWLVASDGGIFAFGDAFFYGSTGNIALNQPVVGMAATPSGNGYWLVASDGGIFTRGDATFHGSTGGIVLNQPVVGMAATPSGNGYWLVASDGGIFAFGDAVFHGSAGDIALNQPIVGMAATPTGNGYWLVASDGGIFSFGDALFYGSAGDIALNQPIVGMAATRSGNGYWLVASDGGIFAFGDAGFYGSTGDVALNRPIVGMAAQYAAAT